MRGLLKAIAVLVLIAVLGAGGYVGYVYFSYDRIDDNVLIDIKGGGSGAAEEGQVYRLASYNVGFGAYSADYSFFMDGGTESRARSEDECMRNITGAFTVLSELDADFIAIQEIDVESDRSFDIDQVAVAEAGFSDYSAAFALNYDSAYLFYPITHPIGKSKSGVLTLSRFGIDTSVRRSLPIESGFRKLIDLDRCYTISRVPMSDGHALVLINLHLSAYTSDGKIVNEQLAMLSSDIAAEYAAGNYVICAGDFNRDLTGGEVVSEDDWAQPIDVKLLPEGFTLVSPFDAEKKIYTCRDAGEPYVEGVTETYALDGFIVSDNVKVVTVYTLDTGFEYSDHNPVVLEFVAEAHE